jgi:predicted Holliday junction resolvase-like endonuclease
MDEIEVGIIFVVIFGIFIIIFVNVIDYNILSRDFETNQVKIEEELKTHDFEEGNIVYKISNNSVQKDLFDYLNLKYDNQCNIRLEKDYIIIEKE